MPITGSSVSLKSKYLMQDKRLGPGLLIFGILGWFVAVIFSVVTGGAFRFVANVFAGVGALGLLLLLYALILKLVKKR